MRMKQQRRQWIERGTAVGWLTLLMLGAGACRESRPEEQASDDSEDTVAAPVRETCGDNPLLAGCSLPESDVNAAR